MMPLHLFHWILCPLALTLTLFIAKTLTALCSRIKRSCAMCRSLSVRKLHVAGFDGIKKGAIAARIMVSCNKSVDIQTMVQLCYSPIPQRRRYFSICSALLAIFLMLRFVDMRMNSRMDRCRVCSPARNASVLSSAIYTETKTFSNTYAKAVANNPPNAPAMDAADMKIPMRK